MTSKETAGRDGKGDDGRARTREVKLAVFFTQDRLDSDGYPVRDRSSTSVIATFEPAAVRRPGESRRHPPRRGLRPPAHRHRRRRRLDLGIAAAKFPEATQVVDLRHAPCETQAGHQRTELGDRRLDTLAEFARLESTDSAFGSYSGVTASELDHQE